MIPREDHICVCVCTYKRPSHLRRLLNELDRQRTDGLFGYSVVVVDNDRYESAREVVRSIQESTALDIRYYVEPEQNIARARNRSVEQARGDFVAIIDDDEFPPRDWLMILYTACLTYHADGVLGPVLPHYDDRCPPWLKRSGLCERIRHTTGTVISASDIVANMLLKREIFADADNRFDHALGRTGGVDTWFFRKVIGKGGVFIWCDEAMVYEGIPSERWKVSYYLKGCIRKGGIIGDEVRSKGVPGRHYAQVMVAACAYLALLPLALFCGKHLFVRYLAKAAYHLAWLFGYFGHVIIRLRDDDRNPA